MSEVPAIVATPFTQPSSVLDLGEGLSCLAYQPSRRLAAVSTVKMQTYLVAVRDGAPGTNASDGPQLIRVGAFGAVRPERLAWQHGHQATCLAAADRSGGIHLFDVASVDKSIRYAATKHAYHLGHSRVACSLAWNPHSTNLLSFSTKDHILISWDSRMPHIYAQTAPNTPTTPTPNPSKVGFSGQGNDIAFSPHHTHLIAVACQSGSTGSLMLFDQRNLSVSVASVNTPGPCTAVDFHPRYKDLLLFGYKSYVGHSKRDATAAFLQLNVDSVRAPAIHTPWSADEGPWVTAQPQPLLQEITTYSTMAKLRWREVPNNSKLSPLWFGSFSSSMDSNTYLWDAFHPYAPVVTFTNPHPTDLRGAIATGNAGTNSAAPSVSTDKPSDRCISDFAWISPSAFLTCSKNSRVLVCTTLTDAHTATAASGLSALGGSRVMPPPTISVALGCRGTIVAVRDPPELQELYEADVTSVYQGQDCFSEQPSTAVPTLAVATVPPVTVTVSPQSGNNSNAQATAKGAAAPVGAPSATATKSVQQPPPPPKEKDKEKSFFSFFKKDKQPAPVKDTRPLISSGISDTTVATSPSLSRPSVATMSQQHTAEPAAPYPVISPMTESSSAGAGGGGVFKAASLSDLPAANFEHEYPTLARLRPSKPKVLLESMSLQPSSKRQSNYAAATSRRVFKALARKWENWYEHCVTQRQIQAIDADDVFVNRESLEDVDDVFSRVCDNNANVCMDSGLTEEDPRYCVWSALASILGTHHESSIMDYFRSALNFTSHCGDTQTATCLFICGVLWWRHRAGNIGGASVESCPLLQPEWKERSYEWVEHYSGALEAAKLVVEWNELAFVFPFAVRAVDSSCKLEAYANPVFPVTTIAHEKAIEFVHCGSCGSVVSPQDASVTCGTGGHQLSSPAPSAVNSKFGSATQKSCRAVEASCPRCRPKPLHVCIVCEQIVQGTFLWMKPCGHGGHPEHIKEWLATSDHCPRCGALLL